MCMGRRECYVRSEGESGVMNGWCSVWWCMEVSWPPGSARVGDIQPYSLEETRLPSLTSNLVLSALLLVAARRVADTKGQIKSELQYTPTSPREISIVYFHILIHKSGRTDLWRGQFKRSLRSTWRISALVCWTKLKGVCDVIYGLIAANMEFSLFIWTRVAQNTRTDHANVVSRLRISQPA
jgi:hypothetical protein